MKNEWSLYNPRTGTQIKSYSYANKDVVFNSISELHSGFRKWKQLTYGERQTALSKVIPILEGDIHQLAKCISNEMGKTIPEAEFEIKKCIESTRYLCQMDLTFLEKKEIKNKTYFKSEVYNEPLGVILSILPWNFPLWQAFRAIIPNLLSGNTILLKHSEITPTSGDLIHEYFKKADLGDILQHRLFSHDLSDQIISDSRIGGVSITGSVNAGKAIASLGSKYFKKCVLELGGSDPAIILEDADINQASRIIAKSRLQNNGQVCVALKRAIIQKKNLELFLNKIENEFNETDIGPLAHSKFKEQYNLQVAELKKYSKLIYEKKMDHLNFNSETAFVNPCILLFNENHEILNITEIFGPCLIVIESKSDEDSIIIANSTIFGLGASIFGQNRSEMEKIALKIEAGQVALNDFVKSDVCLPFGGTKMSGFGREIGQQGFFEFTQIKVISS